MTNKFLKQLNNINLTLNEAQLNNLKQYCDLLIEANKKCNLVSNADFDTIMLEHIADSLSFNLVNLSNYNILDQFKMIDIGSGGGFPGIPIAILHPEGKITLTESIKKKCLFLEEVSKKMEYININVLSERIETLGHDENHREQYDIVTARAVANINTLIEYALPLLKVGGIFVSYKTESSLDDLKKINNALNILGGNVEEIINYDFIDKELKRTLIIIKKVKKTGPKYPREVGIPSKKPLK